MIRLLKDYYSLFAFFNNIDAKPETERRYKEWPSASYFECRKCKNAEQKKSLDELGAKMSDIEESKIKDNNFEELLSELQEQLKDLKSSERAT